MASRSSSKVGLQRQKELRAPDPFLLKTTQALEWMQARRRILLPSVGVVIVVGCAIAAWNHLRESSLERAAASLDRALVVATAPIRSRTDVEDEAAPPDDDRPVFVSEKSRARAALNAYRRTLRRYGESPLGPTAKLGEATALYDLGRLDEAKRTYEQLLQMPSVRPDLRAQAVEGIARCLEEKGDVAGALRQLDGLRTMDEGAFRDLAQYGRARLLQRDGKYIQARELYRSVIERLGTEDVPDRPYLRSQIEVRMRELEALTPADSIDERSLREGLGGGKAKGGSGGGGGRGGGGPGGRRGDPQRSKPGKSR